MNERNTTLQAQPSPDAGVSDEEIEEIARGKSNHIEFARAILALRPAQQSAQEAVPMTEGWRLLGTGEQIEAGDECLHDDCVTWWQLVGWEVGQAYNPILMVPMRRRVRGITAQGAQEPAKEPSK